MAIKKLSEESLHNIKRKSAKALPDKPSAQGYTAEEIKNYLTNFVIDDTDSFKAELDRIVDEINLFISGIENEELKNYIIDAIVAKFTEQNPIISLNFNKETKLMEYSRFLNQGVIDLLPDDSVFISSDILKNKQGAVIYPKTSIDKLIDTIDNKTVREYILNLNTKIETLLSKHDSEISSINENIAAIIGGDAPAALDSIKELAEALNNNPSQVDNILLQIQSLNNSKVDKIDGKQLSSNDYSNEDKSFVDSLRTKDLVGIEDLKTDLKQFNDDSEHRLVTDEEKNYWNGKEDKGHKHEIDDVNGLNSKLNSKSSIDHTHTCEEIGAEKSGVSADLLSGHNLNSESHKDIRNYIENVEKKVDGINQAISFVNERQLEDWIQGTYSRQDGKTVADLFVGQHIYIEDQDERDFWVNETPVASINNLTELVTDKIELEDYMLREDLSAVATSGSYKDLKDTPKIYYNLSEMVQDQDHKTITDEKLKQIDTNTEKIEEKFDKNLGIDEANKMLITDDDGNVTTAVAGSMAILVDNLTSSSTTMPLSANQGRILNNIKLDKQQGAENVGKHLIVNDEGLIDLEVQKTKLSEFENDKKFATEDYVNVNGGKIDAIKIKGTSVAINNKEIDLNVPTNDEFEELLERTDSFITKNVNDLTNYTLSTGVGSKLELSVDSSTYVMTLKLKNAGGTVLDTKTVDLPLETMVVGADYDKTNKQITLTLQNGTKTSFSVADLVSGLASTSDLSNYLPKSGGTMTGSIRLATNTAIGSSDGKNLISWFDSAKVVYVGETDKTMYLQGSNDRPNYVNSKNETKNLALLPDVNACLALDGSRAMTGTINAPKGIKVGTDANAYNDVGILFGDAGARIGVNKESGIFGFYSNNEVFIRPYYSSNQNNGVKINANAFYPSINGQVSLGTSNSKFKELYLTGGATMNGSLNLNGSYPQITTTTADFIIQTSGGKQYEFNDTEFRPVQNDAGKLNIGRSDRRFKDGYFSGNLYLDGNLHDGTNYTSIADIKKKFTWKCTISGAVGWYRVCSLSNGITQIKMTHYYVGSDETIQFGQAHIEIKAVSCSGYNKDDNSIAVMFCGYTNSANKISSVRKVVKGNGDQYLEVYKSSTTTMIFDVETDHPVNAKYTSAPSGDTIPDGYSAVGHKTINYDGRMIGTISNATKLNNQDASYYLNYNNLTNTPTNYVSQISKSQAAVTNPTNNAVVNVVSLKNPSGTEIGNFSYSNYFTATTELAGLMSAEDKTKLDGLSNAGSSGGIELAWTGLIDYTSINSFSLISSYFETYKVLMIVMTDGSTGSGDGFGEISKGGIMWGTKMPSFDGTYYSFFGVTANLYETGISYSKFSYAAFSASVEQAQNMSRVKYITAIYGVR